MDSSRLRKPGRALSSSDIIAAAGPSASDDDEEAAAAAAELSVQRLNFRVAGASSQLCTPLTQRHECGVICNTDREGGENEMLVPTMGTE
jgi:hypothetical protein